MLTLAIVLLALATTALAVESYKWRTRLDRTQAVPPTAADRTGDNAPFDFSP